MHTHSAISIIQLKYKPAAIANFKGESGSTATKSAEIRGPGGPWPLFSLRSLHRNVIFAIENNWTLAN